MEFFRVFAVEVFMGIFATPMFFWNQVQNRVILIDFDWSGINGIKHYPCGMNPEVQWPDCATTGKTLLFDHDSFWID